MAGRGICFSSVKGWHRGLNSAQADKLYLLGDPKAPSMIRERFGETTPLLQILLGQGTHRPWPELHIGDRAQ